MTMDDLFNTRIAQRMQEIADEEFKALAPLMDVGSYTAHQVFDHFDTIRKNAEERMKNELKKSNKSYDTKERDKLIVKYRPEALSPECMEKVSVTVETFKCSIPRYILFKVLHKFEHLASIPTKLRKKFIREAKPDKPADVSFQVDITKPMMAVSKAVSNDELHLTLQRVALDFGRGYVVASDGHLISAVKADYQNLFVKDGAQQFPVLVTGKTFKQCQGNLSVSVEEQFGVPKKYRFLAADGAYYEEEFVGKYPNWFGVVPKELFRSGRVSLSKEGVKQLRNFAKMAVKNGIGKRMWMQCNGQVLELNYQELSTEQTFSKSIVLDEQSSVFTIGLRADYVSCLDGWNGTMWITNYAKSIIFDKDKQTDFYLLMPMMLPTGVGVQDGINGTKVSFDERHTEYRNLTDCKQSCKQTSKQESEIITQKLLFMAAERYEGTQPFYTLEEIERGEFRIKGNHDSDLVLFLRTAAHYIRQSQELQAEFCGYCREQMSGKDWRSIVPLEEMALAEMFEGFLTSKGINDIPDVEFEDTIEEVAEEVENQFVDNHEMVEVPAVVEEVEAEEIEAEEVIEEAVEVIEEAAIKPMAIEREIVPTLELETSEGTLIVAGESYFHKLYDEDEGCFRSEAAEAKFNEIDAFIADELITADELDYAAIAQAVGEFMEEVEQAS